MFYSHPDQFLDMICCRGHENSCSSIEEDVMQEKEANKAALVSKNGSQNHSLKNYNVQKQD